MTGQYYMHQFVPEQPELNWRNPELKAAMFDTLRFWLDRGVDGFRMDVIGLIIKDEQLRDNPLNPDAPDDLPENFIFGRLKQVYNMDQNEVHEVLKDIRALFDEYEARVAIGELWGDMDRWVKYYGEQGDELHLPFNFRLMHEPFTAVAMRQSVSEMEAGLPDFAWPNYVLGNHDGPRLATRFGGQAQARLAGMMLLTLRGTPTIYYGEELGLENGNIKPDQMHDPQGINLGVEWTRDVCRTPMQWDDSPYAGFSEVETWLPVSADYQIRNVASQSKEPTSILNLYRKLLWYRRATPALEMGSYHPLDIGESIFAYVRQLGAIRQRLIVLNFADNEQIVTIPGGTNGRVVISTYLDREEAVNVSSLWLRPFEGVVIEL